MSQDSEVISRLEQQALQIRKLLDARTAKRPYIIEFSGLPKSGKTTAMNVLSLFFRRNGVRAETFTERASLSPISDKKGHPDFNVWVSCASLLGMIESVEKNIDLFMLDRGIFDALVWNTLLTRTGKITREEADTIAAFFTLDRWTRLVDLVCIMKCEPTVSLEREYANQLTLKTGNIMSENTLREINAAIEETVKTCGPKFKKTIIMDTSAKDAKEGATAIALEVLEQLKVFLDESLCVLHKSKLPVSLPKSGFVFDAGEAQKFIDAINAFKEFIPRSKAEYDPDYLIPISCAILAFKDRVLILKRKEEGHSLHDTYAIWAGGHVRSSDDQKGRGMVESCLKRELMEELYVQGEYDLELVGLVRTDQDERASRHIGVVYRASLKTDKVALALDQKEFRETRGTSVSGKLISTSDLQQYFGKMGDWSKYMVEKIWPNQSVLLPPKPGSENQPKLGLK